MAKYRPGENSLTNNFRANMAILSLGLIGFILLGFFGFYEVSLDFSREDLVRKNLFLNFLTFLVSYFFTSYWFSPDLDVHNNRPGKGSFPFKVIIRYFIKLRKSFPPLTILISPLLLIVEPLHYLLNFIWRWYWHPFGNAFTHRGVIHWPLIGTQIKLLYVLSSYWLLAHFVASHFISVDLPFSPMLGFFDFFLSRDGFYQTLLSNELLLTMVVAMSVSDICHTAVDYYDTVRNGSKNFVPPEFIAPRGFILQFFKFFWSRISGK